ncbi:MAG: hypothetical protein Q9179_003570 [Wetmoreana sp. 5 TL-2023]
MPPSTAVKRYDQTGPCYYLRGERHCLVSPQPDGKCWSTTEGIHCPLKERGTCSEAPDGQVHCDPKDKSGNCWETPNGQIHCDKDKRDKVVEGDSNNVEVVAKRNAVAAKVVEAELEKRNAPTGASLLQLKEACYHLTVREDPCNKCSPDADGKCWGDQKWCRGLHGYYKKSETCIVPEPPALVKKRDTISGESTTTPSLRGRESTAIIYPKPNPKPKKQCKTVKVKKPFCQFPGPDGHCWEHVKQCKRTGQL